MNYGVISLAVLCILLIYFIYYLWWYKSSTLASSLNLNKNQYSIPHKALKNPSSGKYAYGFWIFINTWNNQVPSVLPFLMGKRASTTHLGGLNITLDGPATNGNPIPILSRLDNSCMIIYLDSSKPSLYYSIKGASNSPHVFHRQLIMDNFPLQEWSQIIFSVDVNTVDIYINGKLMLSNMYAEGLAIPDANTTITQNQLVAGNNKIPLDATMMKLQNWPNTPMDPKSAKDSYLSGNGDNVLSGNYNLYFQLLKNGELQSQRALLPSLTSTP
jgi:hypothetical protein